jgi:hypothetical protein
MQLFPTSCVPTEQVIGVQAEPFQLLPVEHPFKLGVSVMVPEV